MRTRTMIVIERRPTVHVSAVSPNRHLLSRFKDHQSHLILSCQNYQKSCVNNCLPELESLGAVSTKRTVCDLFELGREFLSHIYD